MSDHIPEVRRLLSEGRGDRHIAGALGVTRHMARGLIVEAKTGGNSLPPAIIEVDPRTSAEYAERIARCYRRSKEAIIEAGWWLMRAKDVLPHGEFEAMIEIDLPFGPRHARRLMAIAGDDRIANRTHVSVLPEAVGTLYELTKLDDAAFDAAIAKGIIRPDMERSDVPRPGASRSMARAEPADSLDPFFTPPWATRALFEIVFPHMGIIDIDCVEEPACGEGHMYHVIREYAGVVGTDIFDYSKGFRTRDFLELGHRTGIEWIITNPPFRGDMAERFVLRALDLAGTGVAMFVALQFLETVGRYNRLFKDRPPTLISFFSERVNCCKGRWDPDGSTDAAYIWLVWMKDRASMPPFWIPPGCRKSLSKDDDRARFAAWSMPSHDPLTEEVVEAAE